MVQRFWKWYEDNIHFNQALVAVLFGWQILHLYWLTTDVVAGRILGQAVFNPSDFYQYLLIMADYAEIPALISGTLLYLHFIKDKPSKKYSLFLILINSQWLHLFWITDEFVLAHFRGEHQYLPVWLAWTAIFIDYLELPVIFDTIRNTFIGSFGEKLEN